MGGLESRREAEDQAGQDRDGQREEQHPAIHRDVEIERPVDGRSKPIQHAHGHAGDAEAHQAAQQTEQHAFRQELLDQAATAGAQAQPNAHLATSLPRPGQEQVGHVDAGDQE